MAITRSTQSTQSPERRAGRRLPPGRRARRLPVLLAALAALAAPAGCGSGGGNGEAYRSPLTGEAVPGPAPVLAVKVDNAPAARPQTGLERADVVYVEQVEGGLTRFLAVYSSDLPPAVGPVRSARESDLELLRQFGEPALAYSGVQSGLRPLMREAPVHLLPPGEAPGAYSRSAGRAAPHNLYVDARAALRAAPGGVSKAGDVGFRFGEAPEGGRPTGGETAGYPAARFAFSWSAERDRWLVSVDGAPARTAGGDRLGAATVVVQYVEVRPSRFGDRYGGVTPYTATTGSGEALVLRDGRAYEARWSRPSADGGTEFTRPGGAPMPFARGPVWVVLTGR